MQKADLSTTLKRIKKIRSILQKHPEGLWLRQLSNLVGLWPSVVSRILNKYLSENLEVKRIGKMKLFKLKRPGPSKKEKQLIQRENSLKLAIELRRNGFSYSEIVRELRKRFGFSIWLVKIKHVKMNEYGRRRYEQKIRNDKRKAGIKGGRKNIKTGHIFRIQPLAMEAYQEKILARISPSSRKLSIPKVRIISHCLFDGFVIKDDNKHHYVFGYSNKCEKLINQFIEDVKVVYGLDPTDIIKKWSGIIVRYCCKAAVVDLMRYTSYVDGEEKIPVEVLKGPFEWKIAFLKCFWDDEGMVRFTESIDRKGYRHVYRSVEAFLKNKNLLYQLKELHRLVGINTRVWENRIIISTKRDLIKFKELLNFSPNLKVSYSKSRWNGWEKRKVLSLAIKSYRR